MNQRRDTLLKCYAKFIRFLRLEYQIQNTECRNERGDCNGDADFKKIKVSEFEVMLF